MADLWETKQHQKYCLGDAECEIIGTSALVLSISQGTYTIDTYTWDKQIGGVLLQKQYDRTDQPIAYSTSLIIDAGRP